MSGAPLWLRWAIAGLSHLAPGPVARMANAVYRRPAIARRFDKGARELLTVAEGMVAAGEMKTVEVAGGPLRYWRFPVAAARGRALLLHGWTADARAMAAFIQPLDAAGYEAVIPDLPAHGGSFGVDTDAAASARAVKEMLEAEGLIPDVMIAHSFGGGVAGMLARFGMAPRRLAAIASPSRLKAVTADFCAAFALSARCRARFYAVVEADAGFAHDELDAAAIWPGTETRILILHAPEDAEVDYAEAERAARLPNTELRPMPGLGHRKIVHDDRSVMAAVAFVTDT